MFHKMHATPHHRAHQKPLNPKWRSKKIPIEISEFYLTH